MNLNHLNLTVSDVPDAAKFLEKYFGMRNMGGNNNIGFLSDENGMVLTLTSMKVGGEKEVKYPATFHIGFVCVHGARLPAEYQLRIPAE
jgi:catechol-2,3-dioxygenase